MTAYKQRNTDSLLIFACGRYFLEKYSKHPRRFHPTRIFAIMCVFIIVFHSLIFVCVKISYNYNYNNKNEKQKNTNIQKNKQTTTVWVEQKKQVRSVVFRDFQLQGYTSVIYLTLYQSALIVYFPIGFPKKTHIILSHSLSSISIYII